MNRIHNVGRVRQRTAKCGCILANCSHRFGDSLLPVEVGIHCLSSHVGHCTARAGIILVGDGRQRFGDRLPAGAHTEDLSGITREVVKHILEGIDMIKDEANSHLREEIDRISLQLEHSGASGLNRRDDTAEVTVRNGNSAAVDIIDNPEALRRRRVTQALCMDWCLGGHFFTPSNTKRRRVRSSS